MHEVSLRWALTMSVIASVVGIGALVLGAFFAPMPLHTDAAQLATAIFIRGFLAILALIATFALAYYAGYRIEAQLGPSNADPHPALASSPLLAMFLTPGPRRDALYTGMLTLAAYWFFTTIYIAALGPTLGDASVTTGSLGPFVVQRIVVGLALVIAGSGAGGLGARNAATRRITQRALKGPAPAAPAQAAQLSAQPSIQQVAQPPSDSTQSGERE